MSQFPFNFGLPPIPALAPLPVVSRPYRAHLLTSNEPCLDSEVPHIQHAIDDSLGQIGQLDAQIGALQAQIRHLQTTLEQCQRRRGEVSETVRQHQSILSPIRRVPSELICEIFSWTWSGKKTPWNLGHICRSWRQHAVSYPLLWTFIAVYCSHLDINRTLLKLAAQLQRSANALLDVQWPSVDTDDVDLRLLSLLLPHSNRWRSLGINIVPSSHPESAAPQCQWLHFVKGHLGQLQHFEVTAVSNVTSLPDVFSIAPNLRQVVLSHRSPSPAFIAMPWRQITHYHGTCPAKYQLEILRAAAPRLLECVIGYNGERFEIRTYRQTPQMITLPNLRRLSSKDVNVVAHLTAPLLERLRLALRGPRQRRESIDMLLPFIHRSACALTRLALVECSVNPAVISVLGALPTLTSLLIDLESDKHSPSDDWATAMSISGTSSDICPRLTSFELGIQTLTRPLWDPILAMMQSRFRTPSSSGFQLLRLRVFSPKWTPLSTVMADDMQLLREEGFDGAISNRQDGDFLKSSPF
ncbi:hypothetical protein C8R47DRAFT_112426 [Mycena vitilis]|nr:hypothetical protein C8R47DRAFT_112426 [Mycena vitilis]